MGFLGHEPLNGNKNAHAEPVSPTNGCRRSRDTTGLGYGDDDSLPIYDKEPHTTNDSNDEI